MTLDELRIWATNPPSKTPQAMTVAGAVLAMIAVNESMMAQIRRHTNEFPALAEMYERMSIAEAHNRSLQTELARVRAEKLPQSPWEQTEEVPEEAAWEPLEEKK